MGKRKKGNEKEGREDDRLSSIHSTDQPTTQPTLAGASGVPRRVLEERALAEEGAGGQVHELDVISRGTVSLAYRHPAFADDIEFGALRSLDNDVLPIVVAHLREGLTQLRDLHVVACLEQRDLLQKLAAPHRPLRRRLG